MKEEVKHSRVMKKQWGLWFWSAFIGLGAGAIAAALAMWAAWSHNPQSEIYNEAGIDYLYWLLIGFSWFLLASFICTLIARPFLGLLAYVFNIVIASEAKQ